MTAKSNRPGVTTEAEQVLAGGLNTTSLTDASATGQYPDRIRPSVKAESYIEQLAVDLVLGHVDLWQLSPALLSFWTFAHEAGAGSRQAEVDRLNRDNDRLYWEVTQRTPKPAGQYTSWADLQKLRQARQTEAAANYEGGDLFAAWEVKHV